MTSITHILVATDFDEPSQRALDTAVELARGFDSSLTLVHVCEFPVYAYYGRAWPMGFVAELENGAREKLAETLKAVDGQVSEANSILCQGVPWQEILVQLDAIGADLLVIGTHGRRGLSHALMGSVAEKLVRTSPVPVLTVRATGS